MHKNLKFNNPHAQQPTTLVHLFAVLLRSRELIAQMVERDVLGRYKGSIFGVAWSLFNPIIMLIIYTFVFSVVFNARWGLGRPESKTDFALILFVGMIVYNFFAEVVNRAPSIIVGNSNYVKKVVFPLEILSVVSLGSALFHCAISLTVLILAFFALNGFIEWTTIFIPLVLLPLAIFMLGCSWFLASLGVYMRDIGQTIGILTTVVMFLSPVFFPVSSLPLKYQGLMLFNPLTFIIEESRAVLIFGLMPNWIGLGIYLILSICFAWLGYAWFQKTRKGFGDVI